MIPLFMLYSVARRLADEGMQPRFFFTGAVTPVGKPDLTPDGQEALKRLAKGDWTLEENKEYAAF